MNALIAIQAADLAAPPQDGLPANLEAEQALLGILLYDNDAYHQLDGVEAGQFREPTHGRIFGAIAYRIGSGKLADPITLDDDLASDLAYQALGGKGYLLDLTLNAPPPRTARDYAASVIEAALRRELLLIASDGHHRATDYTLPAREHLEAVEAALFNLGESKADRGGFRSFDEALEGALEMAEAAASRSGEVSGLSTGLADLDQRLGGLHPSDLIVLAGRPSMGKTALATTIAFNMAKSFRPRTLEDGTVEAATGARVGFFSLEMSKEQLALRILADASDVSGDRIRKGQISYVELGRIRDARALLRSIPLHIDETGGISIAKLSARARRLKRTKGLDCLVIDYIQLASGTDKSRGQGRVQEVSEITAGLKALAKDLGVPIIALSQLSRQVESRDDKRPQLADLRESGSIEQDADVVMFVYREAYYLERAEPREGTTEHLDWSERRDQVRDEAEVIIGKQRHGPIGTVKLHFNGATTRFSNGPGTAHGQQQFGGDQ